MPYPGLPESKWADMERCVEKVKGTVDNPYAVCMATIGGKHSIRELTDMFALTKEAVALIEEFAAPEKQDSIDRVAFEPFAISTVTKPFKILPLGKWFRGARELNITYERAAEMVKNFNAGLPRYGVSINVEHGEEPSQEGSIGWIKKISLRDDGVYADEVEFNSVGQKLVSEERYRGVSPEIIWSMYDKKIYQDPKTGVYHDNVLSGLAITTSPFFGTEVAIFSVSAEKLKEAEMTYADLKAMKDKGASVDEMKAACAKDGMSDEDMTTNLKKLAEETAKINSIAERMAVLEKQSEQFAAMELKLKDAEASRNKLAEEFAGERLLRRTAEFKATAEQFNAVPAKQDELGAQLLWLNDSDSTPKKEHYAYFEGLLGKVQKSIQEGNLFAAFGSEQSGANAPADPFLAAVEALRVSKFADKPYAVGFTEAFKAAELASPELARQYANEKYHKD